MLKPLPINRVTVSLLKPNCWLQSIHPIDIIVPELQSKIREEGKLYFKSWVEVKKNSELYYKRKDLIINFVGIKNPYAPNHCGD